MENAIKPLLDILHELYIGTDKEHSWVIDRKPGHGLSRTIKELSAEEASKPLVDGGTTVASHTEHLRWSLVYALQFFAGKKPEGDWKDSWTVHQVNETEWKKLQQDLLDAYEKVKAAINDTNDWSAPNFLQGTLALAPHAAYHLGAVKQLVIASKR